MLLALPLSPLSNIPPAIQADRTFRYEPLKPFEHIEHGKEADPTFKDLLKPGSNLTDLTASIGAELTGVQLSSLDNAGKDQLALLVAQKKVIGKIDYFRSCQILPLKFSCSVP